MQISIFGTGYVGLVTGACFSELGNNVTCFDINKAKISLLKNGKMPFHEPGLEELVNKNRRSGRIIFTDDPNEAVKGKKIIFIAVGTPQKRTGEADLSYVESAARMIGENIDKYKIIINKSTVPVGTGSKVREIIEELSDINFDVVSNPEFLSQGNALNDFQNPERIVIGTNSVRSKKIVNELYSSFNCPILNTTLETAEMIKYASNAFLATKISFINEIANICERVEADIEDISYAMGLDSRIGNKFLNAGVGYGGSCFPKDVKALYNIASTKNYDFKLLKSVIKVNNDQRMILVKKAENLLGGLKNKKICVWGLTFKPNTDDIRESAGIDIVSIFHRKKALMNVYDPKADYGMIRNNLGSKIRINFYADKYDALEGCHLLVIATEWNEFKNADLAKVKKRLKESNIVDGRNIFKVADMKKKGFNYLSVGR